MNNGNPELVQTFAQTMDRAELLHAAKYDINLIQKNIHVKFELVKLLENSSSPPQNCKFVPP